MLTLSPTRDWDYVRACACHPKLWPFLADDFSPAPEDWQPVDSPAMLYVKVSENETPLGFFLLCCCSPVLYTVHTALLPQAWGQRAAVAAQALIAWVWEHTDCQRLITEVPRYNRLALKFAERAGMKQFGVNPKAFQRDGILHDLILLGISKE